MDDNENDSQEEMTDITLILEAAASNLNFKSPMLHTKSFNLQDSMAALEIMDKKMDCCEVPCRKDKPADSNSNNSFEEKAESVEESKKKNATEASRMIFPRPAPTGLDDDVDPLPWDELTLEDAVFIATENLVLLESLLTDGTSVVESTFTCLYAHTSVVEDMKNRLEPSSLTEQMQAIMSTTTKKGTVPQRVVYSSTLMLIELTDLLREVILNADIYEEEDFTISTYNIDKFDDRDDVSVTKIGHNVLEILKEESFLNDQHNNTNDADVLKAINSILEFQLDFITVITSMARLSGKSIQEELTKSQVIARAAVAKVTHISMLMKKLKTVQSESTKVVIKRTFDSYVNRPLVGNAPLRKIVFRETEESLSTLKKIIGDVDSVVCNILLKGNTLGRVRYMMRKASTSSANILIRSLLVLNLYFDDKMFGQYPVPELIVNHMKQLMEVSDNVFSSKAAQAFLNRLCKPVYDSLKVLVLNKNRQRSYIDVMLGDWSVLREEAYIVDMTYHQEIPSNNTSELQPHFSLYILCITIELMDKFVHLGVELKLLCSEEELGIAYWYRDFLTSSLLSQVNTMRQEKLLTRKLKQTEQLEQLKKKQQQHQSTNKSNKGGSKKKGKNKKNGSASSSNNNNNNSGSSINDLPYTPEDIEDDFDYMLLNVKRNLCRGLVRFFAAVRQAGLVKETFYEFTTNRRIFEMRFEIFAGIQQPPPLSFDDYMKGSDFSEVSQKDLLASTGDTFRLTKGMIDRLLVQIPDIDSNYLPAQEEELRQLAKVCVGNSIYLQKLIHIIEGKGESKARVTIDTKTSNQFCTIKID
ncbi:MAG: hypothetical protein ACI8RD_007180 [Bacillariaceae sp.]|jgi:hypothetical protein